MTTKYYFCVIILKKNSILKLLSCLQVAFGPNLYNALFSNWVVSFWHGGHPGISKVMPVKQSLWHVLPTTKSFEYMCSNELYACFPRTQPN